MLKIRNFILGLLVISPISIIPAMADNPYMTLGTPVSLFGCSIAKSDNGPCVNAAISSVATGHNPAPVSIPDGLKFSTPISNPSDVPVSMNGCMIFTGSGADAWVEGSYGGVPIVSPSIMPSSICVKRSTRDWSDNFAGISIRNVYSMNAYLQAENFHTCIDQQVDYASYYNVWTLGPMISCKVGHALVSRPGSNGVNNNTYIGGRFSTFGGYPADKITGLLWQNDSNDLGIINGNVWINPDFELVNSGSNNRIRAIDCQGTNTNIGQNNIIQSMRFENNASGGASNYLLGGLNCTNNNFNIGYGYPDPASSAVLLDPDLLSHQELAVNGFSGTGGIAQGTPSYIPLTIVARNEVVIRSIASVDNLERSGDGAIFAISSANLLGEAPGFALTTNTIQTTSSQAAYGKVIDLRDNTRDFVKNIIVNVRTASAGGRLVAVVYDSSGTKLTSGSSLFSAPSMFFSSGLGVWETSSDLLSGNNTFQIVPGVNAAFIFIGIFEGVLDANVQNVTALVNSESRFHIITDKTALSLIGGTSLPILPEGPVSVGIPKNPSVGNTYQNGIIVPNVSPTSGSPSYWTFTGAGTWAAGPNIP